MIKKYRALFISLLLLFVMTMVSCGKDEQIVISGSSALTVQVNEEIDLKLTSNSNSKFTQEQVLANIELTSSNDEVVKVENGKIKSVKPGEATVKAAWKEDKSVYFESKITVVSPKIEGAKIIEPSKTALTIGETLQLNVEFNCVVETTVTWKSSDKSIATVNNGLITVLKLGSFTVTAKFSNEYETVEKNIDFTVLTRTFNITYELDGGVNNVANLTTYTENDEVALYNPTKEGYTFLGWYLNDERVEKIDEAMTGDITLAAKWEYVAKIFNITYELDGGVNNEGNPSTYTELTTTTLLAPTKEGSTFLGWYLNDERIEEINEAMTGDITLVAKWEAQFVEVTYNLNGGAWSWTTATVSDPAKGIDSVSNLPEILMADFYYYLKTNKLLEASVVSTKLSSKGFLWSDFSKNYDDPVALYNWTSTGGYGANDGYSQLFYDSYDGTNVIGGFFGTSPYKEKYENLFNFMVQLTSIKYSGSNVTENTFKSKMGFVLDGYLYGTQGLLKSGNNYETFNAMRALIPTPTTSYVGTTMSENDYVITKAKDLINLVAPVREGYAFMGWYDNEEFNGEPLTSVTTSTTLYAKWFDLNAPLAIHTISYQLNGGTNSDVAPIEYTEGLGLSTLPIPTKEGFNFLGWSENTTSTTYITSISKYDDKDYVLVANWGEILDLQITYVYEDGHTPLHTATSLNEFAETFWQEFYAWSKKTVGLEAFKTAALNAWKSGSDGGYKVYLQEGKDVIDENYFANAKGNELWHEWVNVFDSQVKAINATQSAWGSTYVGYLRLYAFFMQSASYWTAERTKIVYEGYPISDHLVTSFKPGEVKTLVELVVEDGRTFLGWYDENDNKVTTTEGITDNITLTAKWSASTRVESFEVTNIPEKVLRLKTYQLKWVFNPTNATNQKLKFNTSNKNVLTVDENGLLYAVNDGTATITVEVADNSEFNVTFDVVVYVDTFIDASYQNDAIVEIDKTTNIIATVVSGNGKIKYQSNNPSIATVDENGVVTGISKGYAEIKLYLEENQNVNLTIGITVTGVGMESVFEVIRNAHNTEIHVMRDLHVAYAYYTDVYNSVSDLLFNYDYSVDESLVMPKTTTANPTSRPGTTIGTMEFITVHYTAGTPKTSDARATANYFNSTTKASANYCTGNDGVFMVIPDGEVAWHAGDGTSVKFTWTNTGVKATANVKPQWGVEKNSKSSTGYYFTLNNQATTIEVPIHGKTSSGSDATIKDPSKAFSFYGPAWKVVDGYYYMGSTWACFTQTLSGIISSRGGNLNSVGIETACNKGSDLWLTYQITAQLVARLLTKYNLDTTRVVGHNMFSGKDCPQTLLANNGELWYPFMECVESEFALYKLGDEYSITCKSNNADIVDNNGRILQIPDYTTTVSYTVTVTNKTTNESMSETYSTVVHGRYTE